jgi:hypothetical protein
MNKKSMEPNNLWTIKGLAANGPDPNLKEKMMLFGQFIGDWEIEDHYTKADGTEVNMKGEVHFRWILDGKAIQDVWMGCPRGSQKNIIFGTTIRFYNPKIEAWYSTWISPIKNIVQTFVARKVNEDIILEGKTAKGYPLKWIFSQITPNSFRWHSEETQDEGKTWKLTEEMQIKKIGIDY